MERMSESLALGEITEETNMDHKEARTKQGTQKRKFPGSSLSRRIMGKSRFAICSLTSGDKKETGRDAPRSFHGGLPFLFPSRPSPYSPGWPTGLLLRSLESTC